MYLLIGTVLNVYKISYLLILTINQSNLKIFTVLIVQNPKNKKIQYIWIEITMQYYDR